MLDRTKDVLERLEAACHALLADRAHARQDLLDALANARFPIDDHDPPDIRGLGRLADTRAAELRQALLATDERRLPTVHGSVRRLCTVLDELRIAVERHLLEDAHGGGHGRDFHP